MLTRVYLASAMLVLVGAAMTLPVLSATGGNIQGIVRDSQTGEGLSGANVVLVGTSMGASSDLTGAYVIHNVPAGSYSIRATYVGYKTALLPLVVADNVGTVKEDFKLDAAAIEGETIVVTAQAMGQNQAINQQLASNQIVNVVSAARIQELPDANAAESVGRLPGVSLVRSGGEGMQVVVRGLQPKYNAITVDGVRLASSGASDRSADLSMISPNMLEGIEVTKAVTADQDADVLGGTVNFKVREAGGGLLEREGLGVSLLAQGGYNGLSNAYNKYNNYKYVGSIEGRFFESRLGVFAQADLERRNLTSNEFGAAYDHKSNSTTDYLTTALNLNNVPRDRQRANGTLVLDYKLPEGKISLSNFLSSGVTDVQNRGETYDIANNFHQYTLAYSRSTLNMVTNALTLEQQLPVFRANVKLSHTYSETKNPNDWTATFTQTSAGLSPFSNLANLNPRDIPPAAVNDLSKTDLTNFVTNSSFSRERALTASLDLDTPVHVSDMVNAVIKFGGKYRYQTRSYDYDQFDGQGLGIGSARRVDSLIAVHFPSLASYIGSTSLPITPFADPRYSYGKFLNGDYAMVTPLNLAMLSEVADLLRQNAGDIAFGHDNFLSTTDDYDGYENQSALYAMATVNIGPDITLIPGIRYQNLQTTYTGARGLESPLSYYSYNHYDTTVTVSHPYWLPDMIFRYKPASWCDVRFSYTNTVAYPDYNAIVPRIDVSTTGTIAWNDHQLTPSRSKNYDVYVSFYENTLGLLTVGGFWKKIDDLIFARDFYASGASALPFYPPGLAANQNPQGVYHVYTYINDKYRIDDQGLELDWQTHFWYLPHPLDGLVMNVNYTHIFSEARYPYVDVRTVNRRVVYTDTSFTAPLLYQPKDIVNLSLGYDYEGFSIRVSMLRQAKIFTGPVYWPQLRTETSAYTRWDLSVKQELPWYGLQVYGDINNISSVDDISVIQAPTGVPQSEQSYGLTADLGIRWHL